MSSITRAVSAVFAVGIASSLAAYFVVSFSTDYFGIQIGENIHDVLKTYPKMSLSFTTQDVHVYEFNSISIDVGRDRQEVRGISYDCTRGDLATIDGIPCGATADGIIKRYGANNLNKYCESVVGDAVETVYYVPKSSNLVFKTKYSGVVGFDIETSTAFNQAWAEKHHCS